MPIPALIGAAAALGTGMMNASSQAAANSQNYKMFREQMSYDRWKFLRSERYNSIQNQVNQMKAAGLNPALMGSGLSSSISAGSSPSGNPMQAVDYSGAVNSGANMLASYFNARQSDATVGKLESETALNRIDAITRNMQNLSDLRVKTSDWQLKNATSEYQKRLTRLAGLEGDLAEQTLGDKVLQQRWNTELTRAEASAQLLALKYVEPNAQAQLKLAAAQAAAAYSTGQASLQQAHNALMEVYAKYGGTKADRSAYFKASLDYLIQHKRESESTEYKNFLTPVGGITKNGIQLPHWNGAKRSSEAAKRR